MEAHSRFVTQLSRKGGGVVALAFDTDHMLSEREIQLVVASFNKVTPIADDAAALFYHRLFKLDPELRPLFNSNMEEQGRKLMQTLSLAVGALKKLEALEPVLVEMGKRHLQYGVKAEHYETVGSALLWTLEQGLAEDFTGEVRAAWLKVYEVVSSTMQRCYVQAEDGPLLC